MSSSSFGAGAKRPVLGPAGRLADPDRQNIQWTAARLDQDLAFDGEVLPVLFDFRAVLDLGPGLLLGLFSVHAGCRVLAIPAPGQGGVNVRTHGRPGADGSFHSRRIDPDEAVCRDGSEDHRPVHQGHPGLVEYGQTGGTDSRQDKGSPPSRGRGGRCDLKGSAFRAPSPPGRSTCSRVLPSA